jgi:hypothetical protein
MGMPPVQTPPTPPMPNIEPTPPSPQFQYEPFAASAASQAPAASVPQQQQPTGAISVAPANIPTQPLAQVPPQDTAQVHADDDSAVDQEWIAKAREIVTRTHSDPYLQSKEISKIKAQYIKVRYNKDIKTVEE